MKLLVKINLWRRFGGFFALISRWFRADVSLSGPGDQEEKFLLPGFWSSRPEPKAGGEDTGGGAPRGERGTYRTNLWAIDPGAIFRARQHLSPIQSEKIFEL